MVFDSVGYLLFRKNHMGKRILVFLLFVFALIAVFYFFLARLSLDNYPVRGIDVSHHQGEIDWHKIKSQNISFAYIKATEGGDFKDPEFKKNWDHALEAGLRVGAYHFFRPETDGVLQAENFISSVPEYKNMLPPAIDVEIDQTKSPDRQVILQRLGNLLQHVESYYGSKPIIYTDEENYKNYIAGQFSGYLLWYRSIFSKPDLPNEKQWAFWQYNPVGRLQGYKGKEFFIDLNVFNGTRDLFETFPTGW